MPYIGSSPSNGVRRVHTYTATASQTTFTGASSEGVTLSYVDANYIDVFQNGVLLGSDDYTATSGTSVVLSQSASLSDLVVIICYDVFSVADTVSKANGGSFDSGVTMSSTLAVTGNQTNTGNLTVNGAFTSQGIDDNANATAITVDDSERVMLGSTSTDGLFNSILQIEGTTSASGLSIHRNGANPYLAMSASGGSSIGDDTAVSDGSGLGTIYWSGADGTDRNTGASWIACFVDGSPGSNDMPGRLVFATTSDGSSSPTERMRISADGRTHFNTSGTALGSGVLQVKLAGTNKAVGIRMRAENAGNWMIAFENSSGSVVGQIIANASSTSYNTSSDHRLKESVTYDFDATTRLKQLKPCRFNFIADADNTVDGFLAHEVQSVVPEAITGTHNEVDDEGNPVYQSIDQSKIVPLLVKTIQELEARITALENAE